MDMKQLDRLSKAGEELPQGLASYKQSYYIASRGLYKQYERGEVDLAKARLEKLNSWRPIRKVSGNGNTSLNYMKYWINYSNWLRMDLIVWLNLKYLI